jgi:glycogen debranching enzyme
MGLKHYGMEPEVNEIATGLFDAAQQFPGYRLPELIGGHARAEYHPPVPYPVACRPQAFTAGSTLHLLQAILGLRPNALDDSLEVANPRLPYWLNELLITDLRLGNSRVNLSFRNEHRTTAATADVQGSARVKIKT